MFPAFFVTNAFIPDNNPVWGVVNKSIKEIFEKINDKTDYNTILFQALNPEQVKIFKILAYHNADKIEDALYRRLQNKSCYVFPVLHSQFVAIVNCKDSAHSAFEPAQEELRNEINTSPRIFSLNALDQGVIIPHYVNCAIDAPLKHGLSLSNYDLNGQDTNVWVTAVTRVDAASQSMSKSYHYTEPICIPIRIAEFDKRIIYQYMYGSTQYSLLPKDNETIQLVCPQELSEQYCNLYKKLIIELGKTKFYFGKDSYLKEMTQIPLQNILSLIVNSQYGDPKERSEIRDAFSKLISNGICGETKKKPKCADNKVSGVELENAKNTFLAFLVKYMASNKSIDSKKLILSALNKLLRLTRETSDINNLTYLINTDNNRLDIDEEQTQNITDENIDDLEIAKLLLSLKQPLNQPFVLDLNNPILLPQQEPVVFGDTNYGVPPSPPLSFSDGNVAPLSRAASIQSTVSDGNSPSGKRGREGEVVREGEGEGEEEDEDVKQGKSPRMITRDMNGGRQQIDSSSTLFRSAQSPTNDKIGPGPFMDIAKGTSKGTPEKIQIVPKMETKIEKESIPEAKVSIETSNKISFHNLEMSYESMFGKYGFDMSINEDGEYELIILSTEEDYRAYLNKYQLSEENQITQENQDQRQGQPMQQQPRVEMGGRRIKKNTKKYKIIKHKTRRIKSIKQNKNTRRNSKKYKKTRRH